MKKPDDGKLRFITIIPTYALYFQGKFSWHQVYSIDLTLAITFLSKCWGLDPEDIRLGGIHNGHFLHGSFLHFSLNSIHNYMLVPRPIKVGDYECED